MDRNRIALVTGASRGLGRTIAEFLGDQRWELVLTARGGDDLGDAAARIRSAGARVHAVPGDVAEAAHRDRLAGVVRSRGRLDLLVNNASDLGVAPLPPITEYPDDRMRRVFEVNVLAPLALVRTTLPELRAARGLVVNISSDAAVGGYPGWGAYGASKAALDLVSKTLASELRESGVGVVSVDPGDMRTAMHQEAFPGQDISDRPLPSVTLPFWAWLLGQDPIAVSGARFQAQAAVWELPR